MNRIAKTTAMMLALFALLIFSSSTAFAQDETNPVHGKGFVDANNDGFNDNAPDADGDGIPNGRDGDYTGSKLHNGKNPHAGFVDLNNDGINDNAIDSDGDGIPNGKDADYTRPQDGSGRKNKFGGEKNGFKKGNGDGTGTGICDGGGNKGKGRKGKR